VCGPTERPDEPVDEADSVRIGPALEPALRAEMGRHFDFGVGGESAAEVAELDSWLKTCRACVHEAASASADDRERVERFIQRLLDTLGVDCKRLLASATGLLPASSALELVSHMCASTAAGEWLPRFVGVGQVVSSALVVRVSAVQACCDPDLEVELARARELFELREAQFGALSPELLGAAGHLLMLYQVSTVPAFTFACCLPAAHTCLRSCWERTWRGAVRTSRRWSR
jgi:hypothetical protein